MPAARSDPSRQSPASPSDTILHASCVALDGRGLLILGPSGSGKSMLALALMALGAELVSDDRTVVRPVPDGPPLLSCPDVLRGRIEARGIGLLAAEPAVTARLQAAVDLGQTETDRLPPLRMISVAGYEVPCLHNVETPHFPAAIVQYLKGGRSDV